MTTCPDFPTWPPPFSVAQLDNLTQLATTYALSHGLAYLPVDASHAAGPTAAIHGPFTLIPTPFPREAFVMAERIQRIYNVLYSRIAMDFEFLDKVMGRIEGVGKVDEFVGSLWQGWKSLRDTEGGISQPYHLGLFRSDYMLHSALPASSVGGLGIKQVEFNTISSSFGSLSQKTASLHRYLLNSTDYFGVSPLLTGENMPSNESIAGLAAGLAEGHRMYQNGRQDSPSLFILFVVQPGERNVFDQRWLEYELLDSHGIKVVRLTFAELANQAQVDKSTSALMVQASYHDSPVEISVVYYRSGYAPTEYHTATDYETRFKLEKSLAIKCPTIPLQLAGGKKIQQVLVNEGVLEHFLQNPSKWGSQYVFSDEELKELRGTWMDMWGLNAPGGCERAKTNAEHLVLKPQREGGGNNVYKHNIPAFLRDLPEREQEAWIAMELILPPSGIRNLMTKAGGAESVETDVVNELGIFGWSLFASGQDIKENEAGWLLRTKGKDSDEGGVAVGYSVLDSMVLI